MEIKINTKYNIDDIVEMPSCGNQVIVKITNIKYNHIKRTIKYDAVFIDDELFDKYVGFTDVNESWITKKVE